MVDVSGLARADVLRALYNRARPQGMGFLAYDPSPMGLTTAAELLEEAGDRPYFDYVRGRVMKVWLDADSCELDPSGYDRDNGPGAAAQVVAVLRETGDPAHVGILDRHRAETLLSAVETTGAADRAAETVFEEHGAVAIMKLGMPAVAGDAARRVLGGEEAT